MGGSKKIYFASDVHLGFPDIEKGRPRELLFAQWLEEIKNKASEIYLVGDIFDFWYEYKNVVPRGFVRVLGKIAEITDAGIPVHFFTGNHDLWVFDYLSSEIGVKIYRKPLETKLLGKNFYIAHGDGLGPGDKGYKLLKKIFESKVLQWLFSRLHPNFAFWIAHGWSKKSRYNKGIIAEKFNQETESTYLHAKEILKQKNIDYFVFGHRHLMINKPIDKQSTYILLGDWLHHFSYGVFDGKTFELRKIDTKKS